jgi:hypothetical protein
MNNQNPAMQYSFFTKTAAAQSAKNATKPVSNLYSNIYLHWFSHQSKKYLRVVRAHHRKEFLDAFKKAYATTESGDEKDIQDDQDVQIFIMAGDLLNVILIDIDKYFNLFASQKEIAKGIWEIKHPLTSKEALLPFIEQRIENYINEYNDQLVWKDHLINMKKDNIQKDSILTYKDDVISFESCDIDNNGNYFIIGGGVIQFLEIIYMISYNNNLSTKDITDIDIQLNDSTNEIPIIIENDRILCTSKDFQCTLSIIRYILEKFGFFKKEHTIYEAICDMRYYLNEYFDVDIDDLESPYTPSINYTLLTNFQDSLTDFEETLFPPSSSQSLKNDIITGYSEYNPYNSINIDDLKVRIMKEYGYTVQTTIEKAEYIQIFKKTQLITIPVTLDIFPTYIKILKALKCDLTDLKDICTLDEVFEILKTTTNSNNEQYLLLNRLTNTIAFTNCSYHESLFEYTGIIETKDISEKTLLLLKDICNVLQDTSNRQDNSENICNILQSMIDNIKKISITNKDVQSNSIKHSSCDFCIVGLVKQKSLIQHFVHRNREKNPQWQDTWSSSSGLCGNILKYLENVKTFRSFPINKNQISIHLEECGMNKKRTANGIKFECNEQNDEDINNIAKEVISKLN